MSLMCLSAFPVPGINVRVVASPWVTALASSDQVGAIVVRIVTRTQHLR